MTVLHYVVIRSVPERKYHRVEKKKKIHTSNGPNLAGFRGFKFDVIHLIISKPTLPNIGRDRANQNFKSKNLPDNKDSMRTPIRYSVSIEHFVSNVFHVSTVVRFIS